ncbi:MAG: hypothetical protein ABJC09_06315 [Terriglobia bacterium]
MVEAIAPDSGKIAQSLRGVQTQKASAGSIQNVDKLMDTFVGGGAFWDAVC